VNDTESNFFSISTKSSLMLVLSEISISSQTSLNCVPGASSIMIYSASTGFSAFALQAKTFGTGILSTVLAYKKSKNETVLLGRRDSLTKSIVATSEAVVL